MRVQLVSLCPTDAARQAGRAALTPELLAATGARYSRNNEGLDAILARIDPERLDESVDAIFRMLDYGHQSIADMAPAAAEGHGGADAYTTSSTTISFVASIRSNRRRSPLLSRWPPYSPATAATLL